MATMNADGAEQWAADSPGATEGFPGFWTVLMPPERIALAVFFTTTARHRGGGVLELRERHGDAVRAAWWRGPDNDALQTIPSGFVWEKNDDYHYGTVGWGELDEVAVSVAIRPR